MTNFKNIFCAFFVVLAVSSLVSCNSCSNGAKVDGSDDEAQEEEVYTHEDTVHVQKMSQDFMEAMKQKNYDYAFDMLSDVKGDSIMKLTPERKAQLKKQFTFFPVRDYAEMNITFYSHDYATITYRFNFMDNPTKDPNYPTYTKITLRVEKFKGVECLTLHNEEFITRPHPEDNAPKTEADKKSEE